MYNSLALLKACENTCMQRFDFGTCIRKHSTTAYADSALKATNAKESFHAHQVSTHALCVSSKGTASKVQNSGSAKPSFVSCARQRRTITIAITFLPDGRSSTTWPRIARSLPRLLVTSAVSHNFVLNLAVAE